jgi:hypothetical protein
VQSTLNSNFVFLLYSFVHYFHILGKGRFTDNNPLVLINSDDQQVAGVVGALIWIRKCACTIALGQTETEGRLPGFV